MSRVDKTYSSSDLIRFWTKNLTHREKEEVLCYFEQLLIFRRQRITEVLIASLAANLLSLEAFGGIAGVLRNATVYRALLRQIASIVRTLATPSTIECGKEGKELIRRNRRFFEELSVAVLDLLGLSPKRR